MRDLSVGLTEMSWYITVLTAASALFIDDANKSLRAVFLEQQLQHLSRHNNEVEAMGKRAQRVYGERFGFERSLKHYNALLLSLQ